MLIDPSGVSFKKIALSGASGDVQDMKSRAGRPASLPAVGQTVSGQYRQQFAMSMGEHPWSVRTVPDSAGLPAVGSPAKAFFHERTIDSDELLA